jgi:hypothetical protein
MEQSTRRCSGELEVKTVVNLEGCGRGSRGNVSGEADSESTEAEAEQQTRAASRSSL